MGTVWESVQISLKKMKIRPHTECFRKVWGTGSYGRFTSTVMFHGYCANAIFWKPTDLEPFLVIRRHEIWLIVLLTLPLPSLKIDIDG